MFGLTFFKKIFKRKREEKEWIAPLFQNIKVIHEQGRVVSFKVVELKRGMFLVKIKGLFGCVLFDNMPWVYAHVAWWEAIAPSLMDKWFYGKVYQIDKAPDKEAIGRIYVDATVTQFNEVRWERDVEYTGIVLFKSHEGVFIDIGCHFDWKCGSLCGMLPIYYFADLELFRLCKSGQSITVHYAGENEQGLLFEKKGEINMHQKYKGKTIEVEVCENAQGDRFFSTEGKYEVMIPMTTAIYGDERRVIQRMKKYWQNGEVLTCSVLGVNRDTKHFFVKYLPNRDSELYKESLFAAEHINKVTWVKVNKDNDGNVTYMLEDTCKAIIPLNKMIYREDTRTIGRILSFCEDGDVIHCLILNVDCTTMQFVVKYLPDSESEPYRRAYPAQAAAPKPARIYPRTTHLHEFSMEHTVDTTVWNQLKERFKEID